MLSFRKKLMSQSWENCQMDGQKGGKTSRPKFIGPFSPWSGVQKSKNKKLQLACVSFATKHSKKLEAIVLTWGIQYFKRKVKHLEYIILLLPYLLLPTLLVPPTNRKFAHSPHLEKFLSSRFLRPPKVSQFPPLNNNFQVINQQISIFSCSQSSCSIFVLFSYSLGT